MIPLLVVIFSFLDERKCISVLYLIRRIKLKSHITKTHVEYQRVLQNYCHNLNLRNQLILLILLLFDGTLSTTRHSI